MLSNQKTFLDHVMKFGKAFFCLKSAPLLFSIMVFKVVVARRIFLLKLEKEKQLSLNCKLMMPSLVLPMMILLKIFFNYAE